MNFLLTLAYDGTNYCGFQVQPNGRSVAATFQDALEAVLGSRPDIKGCSRTDFRWDDEQGEAGLFVLETNTQPGMTALSLVPEQAKHCGISYEDLVETLVDEALDRGAKHG